MATVASIRWSSWRAPRAELDKGSLEEKKLRKFVYRYAERMYHACDIDEDGVLGPRELPFAVMLSELVAKHAGSERRVDLMFSEEAAQETLRMMDRDGDGRMSLEEYGWSIEDDLASWGFEINGDKRQAWLQEVFAKADIDGDGSLNAREAQYANLIGLGALRDALVHFTFDTFDLDGDKRIEWEDVAQHMLKSAHEMPKKAKGRSAMQQIKETIRDGFGSLDLDGDGALVQNEVEDIATGILDSAWRDA